ncbi:MAG TPA: hypothetical protein PLJ29_19020 [Leptospiraceae bacterium]|nr:hypothetical protein [Leptospiraceae bacterium]HMY68819.1 hypothetical protein [Leptospiraceae bacterium]HNF28244.1 hypothetical protein [Leptospiraceae bacterium]HNI28462.1 hypothetical protein [Leptospiraceae bacterium]HNI99035.1 hypothetical protein [Leptospiraceae bacterium]
MRKIIFFTLVAFLFPIIIRCSKASYLSDKNTPYWDEYYAERERDHITRGKNLQGTPYCEEMRICMASCAEKYSPKASRLWSNPKTGFNDTIYSKLSDCEQNCRSFDPCKGKE